MLTAFIFLTMNLNDNDLLWLQLAFTPEMRPRHIPALMEAFGSGKNIVTADLLSLTGLGGLPPAVATAISSGAGKDKAEKEIELMEKTRFG